MNQALMNRVKKMQQEMEEEQAKIEEAVFIGKASGVVAEVQGTKAVISVKIDPEMIDEIEFLQDAICLAINDALGQVEAAMAEVMGQFKIPGLGF